MALARSAIRWRPCVRALNSVRVPSLVTTSSRQKSDSTVTPPPPLDGPSIKDNVDFKNIALKATSGGRSSAPGIRATVFGASGFLGRYVVQKLGNIGAQVIVPYRFDGREVRHLKPMGDVGQIIPVPYDIRDKESVEKVVRGSNFIINLVGCDYETWNFSYEDVHVHASHMLAKVGIEQGVPRFIQMSCAQASPDSISEFLRTKWQAEQVVKSYYPEATIFRPTTIYGLQDRFIQTMAKEWRGWIVVEGRWFPYMWDPFTIAPHRIMQPVAVEDVALAVLRTVLDVRTAGETYQLYGNIKATQWQWFKRIGLGVNNNRREYRGPGYGYDPVWIEKVLNVWEKIWRPRSVPLCLGGMPVYFRADMIRRRMIDDVPEDDPAMKTFDDLGITQIDYYYREPLLILNWSQTGYDLVYHDERPIRLGLPRDAIFEGELGHEWRPISRVKPVRQEQSGPRTKCLAWCFHLWDDTPDFNGHAIYDEHVPVHRGYPAYMVFAH